MKKSLLIIIALFIVGGVGAYFYFEKNGVGGADTKASVTSGADASAIAEISTYKYTETYSSPEYKFSFKYPSDFTVSNLQTDTGEAILVENIAKKIGVQIMISDFEGSDIDVTKEVIKTEIPDMQIKDEQEVVIGANRKGLAFISENESFGKSREVWFVFGGNLYQISTYAELDGFLQGLFATWQFSN